VIAAGGGRRGQAGPCFKGFTVGWLPQEGAATVRSPNTGIVQRGRAVFAHFNQTTSKSVLLDLFAVNDNRLEADAPTLAELMYLRRGLAQPGGKLPLFDLDGQEIDRALVRHCLACGWVEPWFNNPLKPDWLVCRLTAGGRRLLMEQ
jgi:hypothetical protein